MRQGEKTDLLLMIAACESKLLKAEKCRVDLLKKIEAKKMNFDPNINMNKRAELSDLIKKHNELIFRMDMINMFKAVSNNLINGNR